MMRALVVLCAAGASALQYEAAALRRALGAAKPLQDGTVIFRERARQQGRCRALVYDALTLAAARRSSRRPTSIAGRTIKAWTPPRLGALYVTHRPCIQHPTRRRHVLFVARPRGSCSKLLWNRGGRCDDVIGIAVAAAAAVATTSSLRGDS